MFNLIAKAKEAGYQFWISASKVLTVTTGTEMGLTIIKTVTDINPCLLVAELMNLGITLSPDNNYFCWLDSEGVLWAVDRHHLYRGNTGEHGVNWDVVYHHGMVIKEGANKWGNSSRLTQSFHFFMFEPIFSPVNALNQPI